MKKSQVNLPVKLNLLTIYEIIVKDLKGFFDGIYGYLLIIIFLAPLYFIFLQGFFISQIASIRQIFDLLPTFLIIFVPAVTMGSFSRETDKQTIEYIITKPIRPLELVIGKILASFIFSAIALLLTFPLPFLIRSIGNIDMGETLAGYIAALLLILGLSSLGVMVSSFFKNQISAFLTTIFLVFVLLLMGSSYTSSNIPVEVANILSNLSLTQYYTAMIRGVIDISDILYYVLMTFIGATIAYVNVIKIRISNPLDLYRRATYVLVTVGLIIFWMIYLSRGLEFRYDLTQSKKYTLSNVTKDLIKKDGKIIIEVYSSSNLPSSYTYALTEIKNTLTDYSLIGGNNVEVQYIDTKGKETELSTIGIQPIQFNEVSNDQFQSKQGYLGIVVKNEAGDKKELIPFVNSMNDIEYQLTRLINKVKQTNLLKIAISSGNGEYDQFAEYNGFASVLKDSFTVESIYIPATDSKDPKSNSALNLEGVSILVIPNPTTKYTDDALATIKDFLNKGGKVIYAVDSQLVEDNGQITEYEENKSSQNELFSELGVKVSKEMVYDLANPSTVTIQTQMGFPLTIQYPFFINAEKASESIPYLPKNILLPWTNYLVLEGDGWENIYTTSDKAGLQGEPYNIAPMQEMPQTDLQKRTLIAQKSFENNGKLIAVANGRIFKDAYLQGAENNLNFLLSLSESLGQNSALSEIKAKNYFNSQFTSVDLDKRNLIRFGSVGSSFALLMLIGAYRIMRRRILIKSIESSV